MAVACSLSHSCCHYRNLHRPNPTCFIYSPFPPPTIKNQNHPSPRSKYLTFSTTPLQTISRSLPNHHSTTLSQSDPPESQSSNSDDLPKQLDANSDSPGSLYVNWVPALFVGQCLFVFILLATLLLFNFNNPGILQKRFWTGCSGIGDSINCIACRSGSCCRPTYFLNRYCVCWPFGYFFYKYLPHFPLVFYLSFKI